MTWAQCTFAFCFVVLIPAVGVLTAIRLKREGKSLLKGFFLGSGINLLTFVACCFIAHALFPRYPGQPVPELLANAFALPVPVAGVAVIWFVSRDRTKSRRFCLFSSAIVVALFTIGVYLCYEGTLWSFRKALPSSAQDIHESYWTDTLLPDYDYKLKAKITEEEFRRYVAKFGLTPHTTTRKYSDLVVCLDWAASPEFRRGWWDPSTSLDSTFVWQSNTVWTYAKYERGHLYLQSLRH